MNRNVFSIGTLALFCLISSYAFAGATPPADPWQPEHTVRILIAADKSTPDNNYHSGILPNNCYPCPIPTPPGEAPFTLNSRAKEAIAYLNQVLRNSHANIRAELAGTYRVNKHYRNISEVRLDSELQNFKLNKNADIVFTWTDADLVSDNFCGKAYVSDAPGYSTRNTSIARFDGSCGLDTFVHEIGHNLGLAHRASEVSLGFPQYAAGHNTWAWVTVMGYPGAHGGLITKQVFSNPNLDCDSFYKCGDKEFADGIRHINTTAERRFGK